MNKTLLTLTLGLTTVTAVQADKFRDAVAELDAIGKRPSLTTRDIEDYKKAKHSLKRAIEVAPAIADAWVREQKEIIARKTNGSSNLELYSQVREDDNDEGQFEEGLYDLEFVIITKSDITQALADYRSLLYKAIQADPYRKFYVSNDCPCDYLHDGQAFFPQMHSPECIVSLLIQLDDSHETEIKDYACRLLAERKKGKKYKDRNEYILSQIL